MAGPTAVEQAFMLRGVAEMHSRPEPERRRPLGTGRAARQPVNRLTARQGSLAATLNQADRDVRRPRSPGCAVIVARAAFRSVSRRYRLGD